jgi:hypothetical protein
MKAGIVFILAAGLLLALFVSQQAPAAERTEQEQHHSEAFKWFSLVKPLGIATLCALCLTFLTGLFRRKLGRRFRKLHIALAITSVSLGLCHGILVFILFG